MQALQGDSPKSPTRRSSTGLLSSVPKRLVPQGKERADYATGTTYIPGFLALMIMAWIAWTAHSHSSDSSSRAAQPAAYNGETTDMLFTPQPSMWTPHHAPTPAEVSEALAHSTAEANGLA
jgi:hypothetical protein